MIQFTINEILDNTIKNLKTELFEEKKYQQVVMLFKIWQKQKELLYLYSSYAYLEEDKQFVVNDVTVYDPSKTYKQQYISFLMNTNLIFIEEQKNDLPMLLTLIYYWLLAEIKMDKEKLNR